MAGKPGMHKDRQAAQLGTVYQEKLRMKIKSGQILDRLVKHISGEVEMTPSQVTAATVLLRKVMPDLASTEIKQDATTYRDTLSRIAEMAGWAVAANQVAREDAQAVDSKGEAETEGEQAE